MTTDEIPADATHRTRCRRVTYHAGRIVRCIKTEDHDGAHVHVGRFTTKRGRGGGRRRVVVKWRDGQPAKTNVEVAA